MSILGVNGALAGAQRNVDKTQKTNTGSGVSFAELAAAKAKEMSLIDYSQVVKGAGSFSDVFPDYHVITKVGTGNVQQGLWERNDFPFDK
ncbi:MAG: hypothetical protein K2N85_09070, partial [Lachnospiraceae bacterium]|nr:hypothetical protein [Lachnospiraceae bacterium]